MKLLLYSLNFEPELTGIGKYNGEMASALVALGAQVTVVCAPPYYPEWKVKEGFDNKFSMEKINGAIVYRCPLYVPRKVTTIKRLVHLFSFALTSWVRLLSLISLRPDVVFVVQPTFFCTPFALIYCKLAGAKAVMHIQDYELDAMLGLGMAGNGKIAGIMKKLEVWMLGKFDAVSSISYSMLARAREKGVNDDQLIFFPNWADTDFVTPQTSAEQFRSRIGVTATDKVVLYAGNMGKKQGLEIVIEAARRIRHLADVKFLMVGAGVQLEELKAQAEADHLQNIRFLPLQEWKDVPAMLAMAHVHLVIQKKGAADAVLPSKLTNILAAGGYAVVTAESGTELGQLAEKFPGIFRLVEPENSTSLVEALQTSLNEARCGHNTVARDYAEAHLNRSAVIESYVRNLTEKFGLA